jgi:hypothetical protein
MNKYFPQAGILTSLNTEKAEGIVMIHLLQHETDWCPIAKNLLYQEKVQESNITFVNPIVYSDEEKTTVVTSGAAGQEESRTIETQKYNSLQVGDEVLVVFLNGDIHQPIIAARL